MNVSCLKSHAHTHTYTHTRARAHTNTHMGFFNNFVQFWSWPSRNTGLFQGPFQPASIKPGTCYFRFSYQQLHPHNTCQERQSSKMCLPTYVNSITTSGCKSDNFLKWFGLPSASERPLHYRHMFSRHHSCPSMARSVFLYFPKRQFQYLDILTYGTRTPTQGKGVPKKIEQIVRKCISTNGSPKGKQTKRHKYITASSFRSWEKN